MTGVNETLQRVTQSVASSLAIEPFELRGILAVLLVSLICGMVGALVVGNRMAFFSDAMAHCAFAGVALGGLIAILSGVAKDAGVRDWIIPIVMVVFSAFIGIGIAFVREQTTLSTDTVIGVFFAGAMGFGALLLPALRTHTRFDPESFLFGNPWIASDVDVLYLMVLFVLTMWLLVTRHNDLVFTSFSSSLARSRRISLRWNNYVFIVLLALIVNFSLKAVGVLLINGLLIVPAATAANVAKNMRQMFWMTITLSVFAGMCGLFLSSEVEIPIGTGQPLRFGPSGPILLLSVFGFFVSMALPMIVRRFYRPRANTP